MQPQVWQREIIEQQLGRTPDGMMGIAYATDAGVPVVLRMSPLVHGKPFPTLYWLSSKDLHKTISQLEAQGLIKQLEQKLQQEPQWRQKYFANHQNYVLARWHNCTTANKQVLAELGFAHLFDQYGIGGLSDWHQIRCLHMHYAHHLCDTNVIGQWLDQHYDLASLCISK